MFWEIVSSGGSAVWHATGAAEGRRVIHRVVGWGGVEEGGIVRMVGWVVKKGGWEQLSQLEEEKEGLR